MAKLNASEEKILQEIASWKAQAPGFVTKVTEVASRPFVWVADKLIPDDAKVKMTEATEKVIEKLQDASQWTVDEQDVLNSTRELQVDADTILALRKANIHDLDSVASSFIKSNSQIAAAEGFGTGLIGLPGLLADLPALLTVAFRLVNQVSMCYGFPVTTQEENLDEKDAFEIGYMLRVLRVSTASSLEEKVQALMELKDFTVGFENDEQVRAGTNYVRQQLSKAAVIHLSKALLGQIVRQTVARKSVAAIPGIGAVLSAGFNYSWIQDVGHSAQMLYRERFLIEKKGRAKIINIEIE